MLSLFLKVVIALRDENILRTPKRETAIQLCRTSSRWIITKLLRMAKRQTNRNNQEGREVHSHKLQRLIDLCTILLFLFVVGYHNQIELTFAIKDTNKESIINDGGNRIATKMAVGK